MPRIYERLEKVYHLIPELRTFSKKFLSGLEKKLKQHDEQYEMISKLNHLFPELRNFSDKLLSEIKEKLKQSDEKYERQMNYSKNRRKNLLYTF